MADFNPDLKVQQIGFKENVNKPVAGSTHNVLLPLNGKIVESARKVLALPLERELSVSTGTFLEQ